MHKSFLFLQTRAPLEAGPEAFDLALTAAAFDHEVRLVLADEGVHWLRAGLPDLVAEAVEQIAVEEESLAERGMAAPAGIPLLSRGELAALLSGADAVVTA
jgi:sulfur relay (sulfurtransferase) DsrF/TusC family protein